MPKPRKMLSNWEAPYIQSLMRLIETQSRQSLRIGRDATDCGCIFLFKSFHLLKKYYPLFHYCYIH